MTRPSPALALSMLVLLAASAGPAWALYKVIGPDGRVTYTDRPPADLSSKVTPLGRDGLAPPPTGPEAALPAELRQATTRYPVTLYTATDCPPCETARQLLQGRGVPFTEKRVISEEDAVAYERVVGGRTVPGATIGSQALRGLSATDWNAYLDAAGYPRESRLPRNWQAPPATPVVERVVPTPAPRTPPATAAPAGDSTAVPAGGNTIRF